MAKKDPRTRELVNLKCFSEPGFETLDGYRMVYMIVQPFNVAVIGKGAVLTKINDLQIVLETILKMEILCLCSVQSYEENKRNLQKRLEQEERPIVRKLLRQDIEHFNEISITMSTNREFVFAFRFRGEREDLIRTKLQQSSAVIATTHSRPRRQPRRCLEMICAPRRKPSYQAAPIMRHTAWNTQKAVPTEKTLHLGKTSLWINNLSIPILWL